MESPLLFLEGGWKGPGCWSARLAGLAWEGKAECANFSSYEGASSRSPACGWDPSPGKWRRRTAGRCTQALLLCVLVRRRDTDTPCFWKPTCFCRHFQEVAVQVDVKVRRLPGQRDARAIPAHGQVLLEADGAGAQHQLHRLGPGEGAGPARIVLHQHLKGRGRGGAVFCQNVLTRPLKVKCPSVKSVVVGISENRADAGLCG